MTTAQELSDREWSILSAGVLGRPEFALGDLDAALGYVRELPGELLSKGYKDPAAPVWGDAIETSSPAASSTRRARISAQSR